MIQRMQDSEYFALPSISNSFLSRFAKCPAACLTSFEATPAMNLGTLAHCLILEGAQAFRERYYVMEKADGRTKEGKAAKGRAINEANGRTIITVDDLQAVQGMATSVYNHPSAHDLLLDGKPEMAITWKDNGIDLKAKADWINQSTLIDLKTCQDSSYPVFSKSIINMGYFRQMAMYRDGIKANLNPIERCIIIAVSSQAPYACECYELDEELLVYGQAEYKRLLKEYLACKEVNQFPSYRYAGIHTVRIPQWMQERDL